MKNLLQLLCALVALFAISQSANANGYYGHGGSGGYPYRPTSPYPSYPTSPTRPVYPPAPVYPSPYPPAPVYPSPYPSYPGYPSSDVTTRRITCESNSHKTVSCPVAARWIQSVEIETQHSGARCVLGYSWGYERNEIWVSNGCRATFLVVTEVPSHLNERTIRCESISDKTKSCSIDFFRSIYSVTLVEQLSSDRCVENVSWSLNREERKITVRKGCRAVFSVSGR